VAKARNRAIEESRGEFIAPLDADDLWLPDKIERQVQRLVAAGEQTGFVYSWWVWIDETGAILDRSPEWRVEGDALEPLVLINFCGNASVQMFRRRWVLEAGGYDPDVGNAEDLDLMLRIATRHPLALVPEILVAYRRSQGTRSQNLQMMWLSHLRMIDGIRRRRPDLAAALYRDADRQFCLYLSGLAFTSGHLLRAIAWAARAGLRLPLQAAPYVLRMLIRKTGSGGGQHVRPGQRLDALRIPEPILPYNRIYRFHDRA
jgi:glycosyltransferase involved in cell wall biosynthesis